MVRSVSLDMGDLPFRQRVPQTGGIQVFALSGLRVDAVRSEPIGVCRDSTVPVDQNRIGGMLAHVVGGRLIGHGNPLAVAIRIDDDQHMPITRRGRNPLVFADRGRAVRVQRDHHVLAQTAFRLHLRDDTGRGQDGPRHLGVHGDAGQ